jgi:hypothetical protein
MISSVRRWMLHILLSALQVSERFSHAHSSSGDRKATRCAWRVEGADRVSSSLQHRTRRMASQAEIPAIRPRKTVRHLSVARLFVKRLRQQVSVDRLNPPIRGHVRSMVVRILVAVLCLATTSAYAADLDAAPQKTKITVRSEIERGSKTAYRAYRETGLGDDLLGFISKVSEVIDNEQQNNSDTDAFNLGAYFEAWIMLSISIDSGKPQAGLARDSALKFFREFRLIQKKMRIDDQTLVQKVLKMNYANTEQVIRNWNSISASQTPH